MQQQKQSNTKKRRFFNPRIIALIFLSMMMVSVGAVLFVIKLIDTQNEAAAKNSGYNELIQTTNFSTVENTDEGLLSTPTYIVDSKKISKAGTYEVGKDIPVGSYVVFKTKKEVNPYYTIASSKDAQNPAHIKFTNIVDSHYYVDVQEGEFLHVKDGDFTPAENVDFKKALDNEEITPGHYRVGQDIPAGTYTFKAIGLHGGSFEISIGSVERDFQNFVHSEFFEKTFQYELAEGEFLHLENTVATYTKKN